MGKAGVAGRGEDLGRVLGGCWGIKILNQAGTIVKEMSVWSVGRVTSATLMVLL